MRQASTGSVGFMPPSAIHAESSTVASYVDSSDEESLDWPFMSDDFPDRASLLNDVMQQDVHSFSQRPSSSRIHVVCKEWILSVFFWHMY